MIADASSISFNHFTKSILEPITGAPCERSGGRHSSSVSSVSPQVMETKSRTKLIAPIAGRTTMTRLATKKTSLWILALAGLWVISLHYYSASLLRSHPIHLPHVKPAKAGCPFPLPNHLFKKRPLRSTEGPLAKSSKKLHAYLSERTKHSDIDSLSIAVVTPSGTVFERSYGVLKANETFSERPVSRDSIYRIASITKMFTVLETLILRERGALNL